MNKINLEILKISSIFKKINKIKMAFKKVKDPNGENRKGEYILTKNTTAMKKIRIKIESYITDELTKKVVSRHHTFRLKTKSLFFTWIWGKLQSGKTRTIDSICQRIQEEFNMDAVVTTTLSDKMLNEQLKSDLKEHAIVLKLNELYKLSEKDIANKLKGSTVLIIDEGDYGMGADGRVAQLINKILLGCKIHVIYVGATNYTALLSELSTPENEIDIEHFGLKVNEGYFGLQEFSKNKNIIDIKSGNYSIDKDTATISKPIRDLIISQNDEKAGLSIIRTTAHSKVDNKAVTLTDKIISKLLQTDKRFKDFEIIKMYDSDNMRDEFDTAQRMALSGKKVLVFVIGGLRAGIAIWKKLKESDKLRFAYESSKIASSGAQGLPGRFCGYYINEKGKPFKPTCLILCDVENIEYYNEIHSMIDNGYLELPDLKFDNKRRPTTHNSQSETMVKPPIQAKLVFKGDWNQMDVKYKNKDNHSTRKYSDFTYQYQFESEFKEWFGDWQLGTEINVNEYTSGQIYERTEYKPYYIMMLDKYSTKCPVMVFELNDTKPNKELIRKVKLTLRDGYSPILANG
jgi:hypothetical protein